MVIASDLQSRDRSFYPWLYHCCVVTLGNLFTRMHQSPYANLRCINSIFDIAALACRYSNTNPSRNPNPWFSMGHHHCNIYFNNAPCLRGYFAHATIPSFSTRIVPLYFQAGGRTKRPNLGLVCCVCVIKGFLSLDVYWCFVLFGLV